MNPEQAGLFGDAPALPGTDPQLGADIAALRASFGAVQVIEQQKLPIPGSVSTVDVRAQDPGEGGAQAVCTCGWRSPVFGADKAAGTMDALQRAADASDLHEWEVSLQ